MPPLPVVSGQKAVAAFERDGWQVIRRASSHIILIKPGSRVTLSIPDHKEVDRGLLRDQIRKAGLSVEDFTALLRK